MAFLPPDVAYQVTVTKYVFVASLGVSWLLLLHACRFSDWAWKVIIWDILNTLGEDYQIVFKRRVKLPTIIYIISR